MKKVFIGLFVVGQLAMASSFSDVRLQYTSRPAGVLTLSDKTLKIVRVLGTGDVVGFICPTGRVTKSCVKYELATLSDAERATIEKEIAGASEAPITPPPTINCKAMPIAVVNYSADNGRVYLLAGEVPCGRNSVRSGKEASDLMDRLATYSRMLNQASSK